MVEIRKPRVSKCETLLSNTMTVFKECFVRFIRFIIIFILFMVILRYHVRNEEVLLGVNEQRNSLYEIIKQKANWIGHVLRINWLLKQVIEGKIKEQIEVTRRQGRRRKKLLDDL